MYIDDYLPVCEGFEGKCAWMYLDSKGNVTAAVGEELPSAAAARALPFWLADGTRPATAQEIGADWQRVKSSTPGFAAGYYMWAASPLLQDAAMDALVRAKVLDFDDDLRRDFPGYDEFPDSVKLALLDMTYNLGDARLRATYPRFDAAVDRRDWLTAAAQCGRDAGDPAFAARNAWTKQQFLNAGGD